MRIMVYIHVQVIYFAILCFFGDHLASRFDEIHRAICLIVWNELPIEVQKMLPLMLNDTQERNYVRGFMNVECSREAFKKVYKKYVELFGLN